MERAAEIFRLYGSFIRAIIHLHAHDRSEEEDLCQEFFLTLIRTPVPADVQHIQSYLYRAVIHQILDSLRTKKAYRRRVKKYAKATRISINSGSPETALLEDTEEMGARMAYFTRHLQERQGRAFVLRYRDNYSVREIAARMGVNRRTVSRYLSTSIRKLRDTLAPD